jgi:hypothetical protein
MRPNKKMVYKAKITSRRNARLTFLGQPSLGQTGGKSGFRPKAR